MKTCIKFNYIFSERKREISDYFQRLHDGLTIGKKNLFSVFPKLSFR